MSFEVPKAACPVVRKKYFPLRSSLTGRYLDELHSSVSERGRARLRSAIILMDGGQYIRICGERYIA